MSTYVDQKDGIIMPKGIQTDKKWREYQLFPEEYFSSSDCFVYFNDIWLDELTALSFSLNEVVRPIFSYASNTWDYVGRGQRIVQGQFRVAFKEAGYMFTVLDHIGLLDSDKTLRLSWVLNDMERDAPKKHYGEILERIEDTLQRSHGDPNAKKPDYHVTETKTLYFKWTVPMKKGHDDNMPQHKNQESRYGLTTSVRQLQTWLKNHGYGWGSHKFSWGKRYSGDTWKTSPNGSKTSIQLTSKHFSNQYINNKISKTSGDWYVLLRYWPESIKGKQTIHRSIGKDAYSTFEAQLQKRLDDYPGDLSDIWMGSPDGQSVRYDGKYGRGVQVGVRKLLELAEIYDGSRGNWVSGQAKKMLEMGFGVTGVYDFPTKLAVWIFQDKMIKAGKLKKKAPDGIVDQATRDLMTETESVQVLKPGESDYHPEELAESRYTWYEKQVWGRPFVNMETEDGAEAVRKYESFFYRGRRNEETGILHTDPLFQKGFDIYINYGPMPQWMQVKQKKIAKDMSFNTTVKAIRNVQITDVQQIIDARTGEPIEEVYSFIAQDLD